MLCDTNILIACLNGELAVVHILSRLQQERRLLFISAITVTEVLAHPRITASEQERIRGFLSSFALVPVDGIIAEHAATLTRTYHLTLPDALIAASAFVKNVPLITRDKKLAKIREIITRSI